jgi:hypothetical protein
VLELLGFEPVVVASMTISVTSLVSGSIKMIRSGNLKEQTLRVRNLIGNVVRKFLR